MWKKIKENWKTYLLIILSALFGADQVEELGLIPTGPAPATYEATVDNTWAVVAWFTLERECGGGATPLHPCPDNIGRYTVFVDSNGEPESKDIIYAFFGPEPPAGVSVDVVSVIPPSKRREEKREEAPER